MSEFLSSKLKNLVPYTPGEQLAGKFIKLNTNESPFPPSENVIKAINSSEIEKLNLYSDPTADVLVSSIASFYNLKKENVAVGNGSDEILAFIFNAFGEKGFVCPSVTYGFYPVFANFFGVELDTIPLEQDLSINLNSYYSTNRNIIIANPNAQTGTYLSPDEIESLVSSNVKRLVVIDEAYIDFGGKTVADLVTKYSNLLVIQTFSKSRSLAGGRVGFALGNEDLISDINTMKFSFNPYNVNRLSIIAGSEAMKDKEYFYECIGKVIEVREKVKSQLLEIGFSMTNSKANFLLVKHPLIDGDALYLKLKERGILVRYLGGDISDYVRITIGSEEQMNVLIENIQQIIDTIKK